MFFSCVCCMLSEVSATDRSLVQIRPTQCGVSIECDLETLTTRRPRPPRAVGAYKITGVEIIRGLK